MDKEKMQHEDRYDYNAYAVLILLLNGWWRMYMTDEQRGAVSNSPEKAEVCIQVDTEQLGRMGFDEDVVQLNHVLDGICQEWESDERALLPFRHHITAEGKLRLDMVREDFLTIILLDGFDMQDKQ